jgi:alkylation response protein AidB-like acyl-CoA dehydrogenase
LDAAIPNLKIVRKGGKVLVTNGNKTYTSKPDAAFS